MNPLHLSVATREGVLFVTIDTPGCPVNILTQQAALDLVGILERIDGAVRAVVLRSAKPSSFLNGASLMLGSAVAVPDDVRRLTATLRAAYEALARVRVPTVAAIRGNCFGCGVELVLRCRYRVAGNGPDTRLRMPEISDYLLIPAFGATQLLPRAVGLEGATDLLLWGACWSAEEAASRGLLDAVFPDGELDAAVAPIADDLAAHGASPRLVSQRRSPARADVASFGRATRARIDALPPDYRSVYHGCYDLVERAALDEETTAGAFEA
ncbi:MAG: enoyl-CoA hydratase/isomerase family protein, partial [Polyangiaceae bacterium]|nr:enoyl-CoA hydratase/isomerase family protein [Polyangiaceae bacterium]